MDDQFDAHGSSKMKDIVALGRDDRQVGTTGDAALDDLKAGVIFDRGKIFERAGGKIVDHNHRSAVGQKALDQMNVQLHHVISDLAGTTGLAIVDAILAGERDPGKLAQLRDPHCHKNEDEIDEQLSGHWREDHLFSLSQALKMYEAIEERISAYEEEILRNATDLLDHLWSVARIVALQDLQGAARMLHCFITLDLAGMSMRHQSLALLSVSQTCKNKGVGLLNFFLSGERDIDAFGSGVRAKRPMPSVAILPKRFYIPWPASFNK